MKINRSILLSLALLVIVSALYRALPGRAFGFAPQIAMAFFAGAVIKDRKWALILPVLSMFISDLMYHALFVTQIDYMQGFYEGQWQNYLLFAALVLIGFMVKRLTIINVLAGSLAAPVVYFITSNFVVWAGWQGTRGLNRPLTFEGLMMCYADGIPFFWTSVAATVFFSAILFGSYYLITKKSAAIQPVQF